MSLYRDQGVVLRTIKLGEADRIVTLVTAGHGKVRAVAKGVRKTKSRFGSRLEPMSHVDLLLYAGRELDVVTQAEVLDHFRPVREDLGRLARATAMLEADALALLRRLLGGDLAGALNEVPDATTREVDVLATSAIEHHLERRLRSASLLDCV